ncbi:MAG: PDZ domain-containing protein [Planctomycetota bacterium]
MSIPPRVLSILLGVILLATVLRAQDEGDARLLRFPHVQGDRVAFVRGGDIWTVPLAGGVARRVTSFDEGFELFPRISPDGSTIAFSAEYAGSRQIYVVPYEGGVPRQLTWYPDVGPMPPRGGYDNLPLDWTPDGKKILVRMNRTPYGQRVGRYFLVDPGGVGLETPLEIPEGAAATFSPDGRRLAYSVISREWRTWKRYRAGRAQDVWIYDLDRHEATRLTDFAGTDNQAMWLGDRIYFTSDRNGTLNLWCHDLATGKQRAVTKYADYDVLFPSRGANGIAFERGGRLWFMHAGTEEVREIPVRIADDRPFQRPVWHEGAKNPGEHALGPKGKSALVEFRGEIFEVPTAEGEARCLTNSPDRRERSPGWSPDGRWMSWLAEAGDDYELFLRDRATGEERQLTRDSGAWILGYSWSPDAKWLAVWDKANRLRALEVETGAWREIDRADEGGLGSVRWSATSDWLAWCKTGENRLRDVWLARLEDPRPVRVTSPRWSDDAVAFDPEGRYLYFSSARDFVYGDLGFEERIYALLLRPDVVSPLAPRREVEPLPGEGEKKGKKGEETDKGDADATARLEIELEGLADRLVALPMSSGRYGGLLATAAGPLVVVDGKLQRYSLEERKAETVLEGVRGYTPDATVTRFLYRHQGGIAMAETKPGQKAGKNALDLSELRVRVEPPVEWSQMYRDAWRIMRDWFYDPKMHRVDWVAKRERYAPLLAHMSHRSDLDFLLGELVGELNAGHTYIQPGDGPSVARVRNGALGCELEVADGRYRIARLFRGENWNADARNPLTEPGVDAREGEFLLAIDGVPLAANENPYRRLEGRADRPVRLTLGPGPGEEGAREVVVRPIASEVQLRYVDWVERNRRLVDELSGGKIGYVHVPNTSVEGHRRLFEGVRALAREKQAILVDDRYNGGGFIPDRMVQALGSRVLNYWSRRDAELYATPEFGFNGPMCMLINGYSSSGGDAFPYYFRKSGLGPLIGQTTWGGLVGYSGSPRLVDGGGLAVPSFAFVNDDGAWDVEAVGVAPDIEVLDDPGAIVAGREPMIERGVAHLLEEIARRAKIVRPPVPDGPDRDR